MAVLSGATASGRQMYQGYLPSSLTVLYTAPSATSNVTSPSATAYVKEIIIGNTSANPITFTLFIASANALFQQVTVNGYDTKVISGLNTMMPAGGQISGLASSASLIQCNISGVEIQ